MGIKLYACTHVSKEASADHYEHGCEMARTCVIDAACDITAFTPAELIERIGAHFHLDIDDVFIPDDGESGEVSYIGYNRLETGDGDEPNERQKDRWRAGELPLYLADYTFTIEKRETSPIRFAEFAASGIKTH